MKRFTFLLVFISSVYSVFGQVDTTGIKQPATFSMKAEKAPREKVYKINPWWELPAAGGAVLLSSAGFRKLEKVSSMTTDEVLALNPNDVNGFDRPVIFHDPSKYANAQSKSDLFLNISIFTPAILALDKKVRKDWMELLSLYLASHAVDNALYFAAAFSTRRPRPFLYNKDVPIEERVGDNKSNSFFSGHTGFATTSTFFLVKVYTDYHNIKGWKRLGLYGLATVPAGLVGFYRMESGRHFRTDVLLGFVAGAASGILVPELHRIKKKSGKAMAFSPYYAPGGATGLTMTMGI
ncbi:membrane-associated phospholipid phosphatase [Filimonas zeae]|nr:phosphatase PAP2 family protein [Filimonas zeae]MDR6340985.1 membrane-associated phospholipid phosphatase [Filimonas zeae]